MHEHCNYLDSHFASTVALALLHSLPLTSMKTEANFLFDSILYTLYFGAYRALRNRCSVHLPVSETSIVGLPGIHSFGIDSRVLNRLSAIFSASF